MQPQRKKTVLIIDDSSFMRGLIRDILNRHGYRVVGEAENGINGVEKFKLLKPDIVTADIVMDEEGGMAALDHIMHQNPDAKVIMISSLMNQAPYITEAKSKGASAFVCKPIDEKTLIDAITSITGI